MLGCGKSRQYCDCRCEGEKGVGYGDGVVDGVEDEDGYGYEDEAVEQGSIRRIRYRKYS